MKKITTLCYALILAVLVSFIVAPVIDASPAQVLTAVVAISATLAVLGVTFPKNAAFTSLSLTDLSTALGAYFRKDKEQIFSNMLLGFDPSRTMEVWDDCKDQVPMPTLNTTELIKPATAGGFSATANALVFGARIGQVRPAQVDLKIVPASYEKTWLGKYRRKGSDAYDMPFEQYIAQRISMQVSQDIRLKAVFRGVYNAAGTAPIDTMRGLLTLITAEIAAIGSPMVPVVTGAITEGNSLTKAYAVHDSLGEATKAVQTQMLVSSTIFDWIIRKFVPILNTSIVVTDVAANRGGGLLNEFNLPGTNCILKREPGFGTSQRMVCTMVENIVYMTDTIGEENNITIEKAHRALDLMIDFKIGVDVKTIHPSMLAVNDQV